MTIVEKAAYLKGLAEGLGIDPQSKEGKLWTAISDLLTDMAHEIEELHDVDRAQADALDDLADECSYLEDLCFGLDSLEDEEDDEYADDEEALSYDGVIYDATCPVCGEEISFDEDTLEKGSILCPNCGETLEFDLGPETDEEEPEESDEIPF